MQAITTIVFDIGNVLAIFPWREYLNGFGFSEEIRNRLSEVIFLGENWREADRGKLSDEEIYQNCVNEAPDLKSEITEVWKNRLDIVKEYPYSASWIKSLKQKGYRVYILSNYGKATFAQAERTFEFLKYVDGKVISYEIQAIKPEPEIYEELIKRYSIVPQESIYLDDLKENIEAGRKFGFHTILFTDQRQAKEQMRTYGVK